MTPRERFLAALQGELVDRPAFSLWRHFHHCDDTPEGLAAATCAFARRWQPDFVKHTPSGLYAVEDWGAPIRRSSDPHRAPERIQPAFENASGWPTLSPLNIHHGALGRELEGLRLVRAGLDADTPVLMTIFSPLTLAYKLVGPRLIEDLRTAPTDLRIGLQTIAETMAHYVEAVRAAGADGLFFATQCASSTWLTRAEYTRFGESYDRLVLEAWSDDGPIILHLHGPDIFFDLAETYPIHGISWHNHETAPSLKQALQQTKCGLVTGLDRRVFLAGPKAIGKQARDMLVITGGCRHILAPSCVIPTQVSDDALAAVVAVVQNDYTVD